MIESPLHPAQPDDIDRVLHAYYHRQMLQPWPAAPRPLETLALQPRRRGLGGLRRRLALAASIALLILGAFFASGKIATTVPGDNTPLDNSNTGSAIVTPELRHQKAPDGSLEKPAPRHNDLKSGTTKRTR
jgi:hypothetical protein